jgi:hypothetical protein
MPLITKIEIDDAADFTRKDDSRIEHKFFFDLNFKFDEVLEETQRLYQIDIKKLYFFAQTNDYNNDKATSIVTNYSPPSTGMKPLKEVAEGTGTMQIFYHLEAELKRKIDPILQVDGRLCWLAAIAMMYSWRNNCSTSMEKVATEIGYKEYYDKKKLLPLDTDLTTIKKMDLKKIPTPTDPYQILYYLQVAGPIMIIGAHFSDPSVLHALVIQGIKGDGGNPEKTELLILDPLREGSSVYVPYNWVQEFIKNSGVKSALIFEPSSSQKCNVEINDIHGEVFIDAKILMMEPMQSGMPIMSNKMYRLCPFLITQDKITLYSQACEEGLPTINVQSTYLGDIAVQGALEIHGKVTYLQ